MKDYFYVVVLCIIFSTSVHSYSADLGIPATKTGGGDFTNFNTIINLMVLSLNLTIPPKEIQYGIVPLVATVGDSGVCVDLKINDLNGGDIFVTGEFLDEPVLLNGTIMRAYEITLSAVVLQFQCTIPLMVEVDGFFSFVNTVDGFGNLTFRSEQAILTQKLLAYSPNFQNSPPVFATPGDCIADPVHLSYVGDNLGEIAGVSITEIVIEELESDPSYVFNDVALELCKLGYDLADSIGGLIVSNYFTNTSSDFYLSNPFIPDSSGIISALEAEKDLYLEFEENITSQLLNLSNQENIVVQYIIPEDFENSTSIIETALEFLYDPEGTSDLDPLLLFLQDAFGTPVEANGTIFDIDIFEILNISQSITFQYNLTLLETLYLGVEVDINSLLLDIFPEDSILPPFQALGPQTLLLESIDLNRFLLDGGFKIRLEVKNDGLTGNPFLETPFSFVIDENFTVTLDWDGFVAAFSILFPLNVRTLFDTQIGPLLAEIYNCLLAIFQKTPMITGATFGHRYLEINISQFYDAILVLVADIIEVIIPVFQPVIPRAIELAFASSITNQVLFESTICPEVDPKFDDIEKYPYNFSEGFVYNLGRKVNQDMVNELLEKFELEPSPVFIIGDNNISSIDYLGSGFYAPVPPLDGWSMNLSVFIKSFTIEGVIPPYFNYLSLLRVMQSGKHFPQDLRNLIDAGLPTWPVNLRFVFNVTGVPYIDTTKTDTSEVSSEIPDAMKFQQSILDISFLFDQVDVLLDLYMRYTQYDVDSMSILEVLNIGCWGSRFNYPGGVSMLDIIGHKLTVNVSCNECQNEMVVMVAESLSNQSTWEQQYIFVNDALDRFGDLVVDLFHKDHFENTISVLEYICETRDWDILDLPVYELVEHEADYVSIMPYLAFFLFAIIMPALIARILNKYGPELNKLNKHEINQRHNEAALANLLKSDAGATVGFEDANERALELSHLTSPMYQNPLVPTCARYLLPILFIFNFILFIVGDTGAAVQIDLKGHILLVPYNEEAYQTLSVITSVVQLWQNGGWVLALLLFCMSIAWPYVKLFIMAACWFAPLQYLSVESRGKIIEFLDFLGRFSFAEFHFLVFVLVVFQVQAGSPNPVFLPEEDLFNIKLEIIPLISLFTFSFAVVVSIIVSNIMLVFQHNIEDQTRIKLREKHLSRLESEARNNPLALIDSANANDLREITLNNYSFTVYDLNSETLLKYQYTYKITRGAMFFIAFVTIAAAGTLLIAASVDSLHIRLVGFFSYLILFADGESDYTLSVFDLLTKVMTIYKGNGIVYFVGFVFISTITLIPMIQTILLCILLFKPVSVKAARRLAEIHHVFSVWCCVDVFVLAVMLTVLELPTVAQGLAGALDFCDDLGELMEGILEPMGYISQEDVEAGCLSMHSTVSAGAYVAILSVFVLNMANFLVSKLFYFYIADRERFVEVAKEQEIFLRESKNISPTDIKSYHRRLESLGFIRVEFTSIECIIKLRNPFFSNNLVDKQSRSEADAPVFLPSPNASLGVGVSSRNPMFEDSNDDYNIVKTALESFYLARSPEVLKTDKIELLVNEALSTPQGKGKLQEKFKKKYNASLIF